MKEHGSSRVIEEVFPQNIECTYTFTKASGIKFSIGYVAQHILLLALLVSAFLIDHFV